MRKRWDKNKSFLSGYYKEIVGWGFFKSRERKKKKCQRECLFLFLCFYFVVLSPSFSFPPSLAVCNYLCGSVSFTLSLFKRGGKDTHPAAFAAAPDFFPFPLRKFPICLCAGLVERGPAVLKQWPMHTLIGKHTHACRVLQTRKHSYIHSLQTLADKLGLGQTDQVCTLRHTRRLIVDKRFIYIWGERVTVCFHCID